jgi:hypothetical protein
MIAQTTPLVSFALFGAVYYFLSLPIRLVCWLFFRTIPHYAPAEWLVLGPTFFDIWLPGIVLPVLGVGSIFSYCSSYAMPLRMCCYYSSSYHSISLMLHVVISVTIFLVGEWRYRSGGCFNVFRDIFLTPKGSFIPRSPFEGARYRQPHSPQLSGKLAFWVWTFSRTDNSHVSLRSPNQRHYRAKGAKPRPQIQITHIYRLFVLINMVPKMQVLLRIGTHAYLFAESRKNASRIRNFRFVIRIYVNIKRFSSLNTTGMTHMCTGVWQGWIIIHRLNLALAWPMQYFNLPIGGQIWAKTTHYYNVK